MTDESSSPFDDAVFINPISGSPTRPTLTYATNRTAISPPGQLTPVINTSLTSLPTVDTMASATKLDSFICEHGGNLLTVTYDIKNGRHYCPQPNCVDDFNVKSSVLRHYEEAHLEKRSFTCILCNGSYARLKTVETHFQACGRRNINMANLPYDAHPSCRQAKQSRLESRVRDLQQQLQQMSHNGLDHITPFRSPTSSSAPGDMMVISQPTASINDHLPAVSLAGFANVQPKTMQTLIGMAFSATQRFARDPTVNSAELGMVLRNLVERVGDGDMVKRMDAAVGGGDEGYGEDYGGV